MSLILDAKAEPLVGEYLSYVGLTTTEKDKYLNMIKQAIAAVKYRIKLVRRKKVSDSEPVLLATLIDFNEDYSLVNTARIIKE